jgi:hopanoid biosynthesis associated RND transporter like protein HpnN
MQSTARIVALPLAMAAISTSFGFLSFIPTDYRGVSELGFIAGMGMVIAFLLNITLLPALLSIFKPPAEPESVGFKWAAPLDRFIATHRRGILTAAALAAVIGLGITSQLRFDFDPLDLKDPHTESVSTLFDLMKDPDFNTYTIDILKPSLAEAEALGGKLEKLSTVDHVMTLASFVPDDQDKKLALIADTRTLLEPTLNPPGTMPAPSDKQLLETLTQVAAGLHDAGKQHPSAERLAKALDQVVARHDHALLQSVHNDVVKGMLKYLEAIKLTLSAEKVTVDNISDDLRRDWVTSDGRALVQAYPKGDARTHDVLTAFTDSVRTIEPDAGGAPISIRESGHTVTQAFIHAGIYALITISLLALIILRRIRDVAILMAPLILAGILTLATIVVIGLPLNFANIIALPLLLSLGVSYAIYFVSFGRAGMTDPLQSSMARAVLFSAATTLVAFGTLGLSSHPGTASMGELLTVALLYSLTCTFFVLPALLGCYKVDRY